MRLLHHLLHRFAACRRLRGDTICSLSTCIGTYSRPDAGILRIRNVLPVFSITPFHHDFREPCAVCHVPCGTVRRIPYTRAPPFYWAFFASSPRSLRRRISNEPLQFDKSSVPSPTKLSPLFPFAWSNQARAHKSPNFGRRGVVPLFGVRTGIIRELDRIYRNELCNHCKLHRLFQTGSKWWYLEFSVGSMS